MGPGAPVTFPDEKLTWRPGWDTGGEKLAFHCQQVSVSPQKVKGRSAGHRAGLGVPWKEAASWLWGAGR